MITHQLDAHVQRLGGDVDGHLYRDALELEDYVTLCSRRPVGRSWGFRISCRVPGLPPVKRLAWAGYRDEELRVAMDGLDTGGPAIFWSRPNTERYPPWIKATRDAPRLEELTTIQGRGDTWFAKDIDGAIHEGLSTSQVVDLIVAGFVDLLAPDSSVEG